jgi:hypothetical protein
MISAIRRSDTDGPGVKPMSLERFKTSSILNTMTLDQAIDHFCAMQTRIPA